MQEISQQLGTLLLSAVPTMLLFVFLIVAYQFLIQGPLGATLKQRRARTDGAVEDAQKAKVTTKATVHDLAVESMTGDSAVVLVVAESDTTNPDKSKRPPAFWRLSVDLKRDDGQLKMAKVDFVQ